MSWLTVLKALDKFNAKTIVLTQSHFLFKSSDDRVVMPVNAFVFYYAFYGIHAFADSRFLIIEL